MKVNKSAFMSTIEAMHPDWYQAMADTDIDQNSAEKRLNKSVERTLSYLDSCLEVHANSTVRLFSYSLISFPLAI